MIEDPEFVNPSAFDFRIRNKKLIRNIKFHPFDYSQAGVYGSDEWKKEAIWTRKLLKNLMKPLKRIRGLTGINGNSLSLTCFKAQRGLQNMVFPKAI